MPVGVYQNGDRFAGQIGANYGVFSIFENWIEDGTFVKLREVSLSYIVPTSVSSRVGANSLRVTLYGRNLLSFDNYSGYDPETNVAGHRQACTATTSSRCRSRAPSASRSAQPSNLCPFHL